MGSLQDYRTGHPVKIDPKRQKLLSAHEVLGATLVKSETAGKKHDFLVRDNVDLVYKAFSQPPRATA